MTRQAARYAAALLGAIVGCAAAAQSPGAVAAGDAARGRELVANRQQSLCLLCHRAPIPGDRFQGDLGPDLAGVGARLDVGQLRQRLLDPRAANPDTIMPSYVRTEGLERVGPAWQGRPIFTAQQVEDVVAWLATLKD